MTRQVYALVDVMRRGSEGKFSADVHSVPHTTGNKPLSLRLRLLLFGE